MNRKLVVLTAAVALQGAAFGQSFVFHFDSVANGSAATAALTGGVSIEPALYAPALDGTGDPIPGSEAWRIDPDAPAVTVDNPIDFDRGAAPSPSNALNALFQPVMLLFPTPEFVGYFSATLDGDDFGSVLPIEFYDSSDTLVFSTSIDQSIPYLNVAINPGVGDVAKIVLPAGAFYDDIVITAVPELDGRAFAGFAALAFGLWARRRRG